MKKIMFLFMVVALSSCATVKKTATLPEDELFQTRKYVGNFIEYRHTGPERLGDPHIIWIKTSLESVYGIISAYSRDCQFNVNDRLFIRRIYFTTVLSEYWLYQIESDSLKKPYRLSKFQYDDKVLIQTWF